MNAHIDLALLVIKMIMALQTSKVTCKMAKQQRPQLFGPPIKLKMSVYGIVSL